MISNQILQSTIDGIKAITKTDMWILDSQGQGIVSTVEDMILPVQEIESFVSSPADSQEIQGHQFFKILDDEVPEYILAVSSEGSDAYMVGRMTVLQIQNLLEAYKEKYDGDNFIKNLLLDNMLLVDIYNRAKKLHIRTDVKRVVMLLETKEEKDFNALERVRSSYDAKGRDFITAVDEKDVIIVKELEGEDVSAQIEQSARSILELFKESGAIVSYGTVVHEMTYWFQEHKLRIGDRTKDQMEQAARSGKQNIAEGHADGMTSLEMEIKLVNSARGSLIELREDYEDRLRTHGWPMWDKSHPRYEKMVQFCYHHHEPEDYRPYFERWSEEEFCNVALTLIHQADRGMWSWLRKKEQQFLEEGGIREKMSAARRQARGY